METSCKDIAFNFAKNKKTKKTKQNIKQNKIGLYSLNYCLFIVLVSLIYGISSFVGHFNAKEQQWYYLTHSWEDEGVHTFHRGICPKVNVIVRLELLRGHSLALQLLFFGSDFSAWF